MSEYAFDYDGRPVIFVDFLGSKEKVSFGSLIDSGSDTNVSFKEIGKFLGIKFSGSPGERIEGIGKTLKGWKHPIDIEFSGQKFSIDVMWINKKINVEEDLPMILGRVPLFNEFNVEFKNNSKIIFRK